MTISVQQSGGESLIRKMKDDWRKLTPTEKTQLLIYFQSENNTYA